MAHSDFHGLKPSHIVKIKEKQSDFLNYDQLGWGLRFGDSGVYLFAVLAHGVTCTCDRKW